MARNFPLIAASRMLDVDVPVWRSIVESVILVKGEMQRTDRSGTA